MSFYDAIRVGAAGAGDYEIERSLRFNSADGPYLENTPSSHSNKKTMTFSFWFKRVVNDNFVTIFRSFGNSDNRHSLDFVSGGQIRLWGNYNGSVAMTVQTSQVFRDPCAWYHFVLALDTTQGTASNRVKMYVNGEQITSFSSTSYPSQNFEFGFNDQNAATQIGVPSDTQCNYYIAEFQEIDGSQLTPSSFGETNAVTGQWNPKKYAGSYGTNGFRLLFSDNSGTTATTLGKDSSGNGRNFTPNNFSVSAGEGNDSLEDTPTLNYPTLNHRDIGFTTQTQMVFSNGNLQVKAESGKWASTRGTFHVKTGKWYWEVKVLSSATFRPFVGIIESTVRLASNQTEQSNELGPTSTGIAYWTGMPLIRGGTNTTGTSTNVPSCTVGDIVGVALDMDNKKVFFSKNGTFFASQDPANSSGELVGFSTTMQNATIAPAIQVYNNTSEAAMNFGQRAFDYTPPTGYEKLNSANLPDPTILLPDKHFETLLYTGNGGTQSITGLEFQPDWVWLKKRNGTTNNLLYDAVRGATKELSSNLTAPEGNEPGSVSSFNSNGFSVGSNGGVNGNSDTFVGWNWNAGDTDSKTYTVTVVSDSGNKYRFDGYGTSAVTLDLAEGGTYIFNYPSAHPFKFSTTADGTHGGGSEYTTGVTHNSSTQVTIVVAASAPTLYYYCSSHSGMGGQVNTNSTLGSSNFAGSIQSTVKVNTTAGFSIATWTSDGSGSPTSFGHGLGVQPDFVLIKNRSGSNGNWQVWSSTFSNATNNFISLNLDTGTQTAGAAMWGTINSSIVSFRHSANSSNGNTMIGYFFNSVEGYSKFGKYTGNGNANGPFVFTGFRPAWVMIKRTDANNDWIIADYKRSPDNTVDIGMYANLTNSDNTTDRYDFLANGFKIRNNLNESNASGGSYLYLAFAESPFKNSRAR